MQLSLFEMPSPQKAQRCKHRWIPLGVEVVLCEKCDTAIIDLDGQHDQTTWPLAAPQGAGSTTEGRRTHG
jgi:hypothetical protein